MRKIPTLYQRDPDNRGKVTDEVVSGCEWVLAGEGTPTHKYDGTCVMYDGRGWFARREVKANKPAPAGFVELNEDPVTGKKVGWEPIENSGFVKFWTEALANWLAEYNSYPPTGTYELCGPRISNKSGHANPENLTANVLVRHDDAETVAELLYRDGSEELKIAVLRGNPKDLVKLLGSRYGWEGVVWKHPNGAMVKLKAKDLS